MHIWIKYSFVRTLIKYRYFCRFSMDSIQNACECPICFEYFKDIIYICESGHSVCDKCAPRLQTCPSCKKKITRIRNFNFEELVRSVIDSALFFEITNNNIEKPALSCLFDKCNLSMPIKDMVKHCCTSHIENTIKCEKSFSLKLNNFRARTGIRYYTVAILLKNVIILKFCIKLDHTKKIVYFALQTYENNLSTSAQFRLGPQIRERLQAPISIISSTEAAFDVSRKGIVSFNKSEFKPNSHGDYKIYCTVLI